MDCRKCKSCEKFQSKNWRSQCNQCRCPNYYHISYGKSLEPSGLLTFIWTDSLNIESHNQLVDNEAAMSVAESKNFVWLPIGLQSTEISNFIKVWNRSCKEYPLEKNSTNEIERFMTALIQIPISDRSSFISKYSSGDKDEDKEVLQRQKIFKNNRDKNDFGFGEIEPIELDEVCYICNKQFVESDVYCVRITHSATFVSHLMCFQCKTCNNMLVDFHYCWDPEKSQMYCVRHFGEQKYSRCAACDELIFNMDLTSANNQEFHVDHFACHFCTKSLTGERYILKDDNPCCLKCFEENFGNKCDRCSKTISCNSKDISYENRHWHDICFHCDGCRESLVDKTFAVKDNDIFCSNCFEEKFAPRCEGCQKPFKAGIKKYEYNGKQWHEDCFVCSECHTSIGSKSFIPQKEKSLCVSCYENKYAQKCVKCSEVIRSGGVTYKGEPWHKECFLCTDCQKMLANSKFSSKDDKPYCAECFTELFSKRCKKCTKPISGFGGCKFISLEENHWHTECFTCDECQKSLVGKGFVNRENKNLCTDCGEASIRAE